MAKVKMYSTAEVAKLLDKVPGAIRTAAGKHKIGTRMGRDWVFTDDDIELLKALPGAGRPKLQRELFKTDDKDAISES